MGLFYGTIHNYKMIIILSTVTMFSTWPEGERCPLKVLTRMNTADLIPESNHLISLSTLGGKNILPFPDER